MSDSNVADYENSAILLVAALYGLLTAAMRSDKEAFEEAYERMGACRVRLSAAGAGKRLLLDALGQRGPREPVEWCGMRGVCYGDLADSLAAAIELEIQNTPPLIHETRPRGCEAVLRRLEPPELFSLPALIRSECREAARILDALSESEGSGESAKPASGGGGGLPEVVGPRPWGFGPRPTSRGNTSNR